MKRTFGEITRSEDIDVDDIDPGVEAALQYHNDQSYIGAGRSEREAKKACLSKWKSLE